MFVEAVLLGLVVGRLRGGRALSIGNLEFKGWMLVVMAFLLQMLPMLLGRLGWMARMGHVMAFATMVLVFFIVVWNADKRGFWLVALGASANIVAMATHGLKMPVLLSSLTAAGHAELVESISNRAVMNYTGIAGVSQWTDYLGKTMALPSGYPFGQVLSAGDLLMSLGILLFIAGQMTAGHYGRTRGRARMMNTFYPMK